MLDVLSSYTQVLDRHESLASNLGARPLGPILIKRFERLFEAPPRVIASHSHARDQDLPQVTWLDVVHFAQAHPSQFTLSTFSEGRRVCQFYYPQKQVRVQISEEDFLFINSGRCQELVPPLPIWEDEEKEVATCEIVEKALRDLTAAADSVAARTRQLAHRLKGRRMAILERRAAEESHNHQVQQQAMHPAFVSVNPHPQPNLQYQPSANQHPQQPPQTMQSPEKLDPALSIRNDLVKHFQSLPRQPPNQPDNRRISLVQHQPQSPPYHTPPPLSHQPRPPPEPASNSVSPIPASVAALAAAAAAQANSYRDESPKDMPRHNFSKPLPPSQEVSQPYRAICQAHMESLPRGSRVLPPCDRCRRLKMDCLKNLSSCAGCTKKHARCHWKDVSRDEVQGLEGFDDAERFANEFDARRVSHEYTPSDESMEMDTRSSYEYPHQPANTTPGAPHGNFQQQRPPYQDMQQQHQHQQQQQQQQYQQPHQQNQQQQQRTCEDTNTPAPVHRNNAFPEDPTQQQPQSHTMDLLRMLGNSSSNNNSSNEASRTPENPTLASASSRNNGAFRSAFAANDNGGVGDGVSGGGVAVVGHEGEGQRV